MIADALITEARARITWGEATSSVYSFLIVNGVPKADAMLQIKQLTLERNAEIRGVGIKNLCLAAVLIAVATIFLWRIFVGGHIGYSTTARGKAAGIFVLIGLYGINRLIKGIFDIIRPQLDDESLSELD